MDMEKFTSELKVEMKAQGITQSSLADRLGLDRAYVNQILNGRRKPSMRFKERAFLALVDLVKAEYAADKARRKVLGQ